MLITLVKIDRGSVRYFIYFLSDVLQNILSINVYFMSFNVDSALKLTYITALKIELAN